MRGSVGQYNFYQRAGETCVREKVAPKDTPTRTKKQMKRRVQWKNIQNIWAAFSNTLKPSFEGKSAKVSDFNEFMSANFGIVPVYLTKTEARQGGCVVAPYQITRGSLPSIIVSDGTGGVKCTDIALGNFAITAATTVKAFSEAVINNNAGYQNFDQISCYIARQLTNAATGVPYVVIEAYEITLNTGDNTTLVRDLVPAAGFSVVDNYLGAATALNGGIVWVHSRLTPSGTKVSTQRFEVTNTILASYQTVAKRDEAMASYGVEDTMDFLTPDIEDEEAPGPGPVPPADEYTLTISLDPEDAGTYTVDGEHAEVGEYTYPAGTELAIHFDAASGWSFGGWKSGETDPDITVVLNADTEVEAIVLED